MFESDPIKRNLKLAHVFDKKCRTTRRIFHWMETKLAFFEKHYLTKQQKQYGHLDRRLAALMLGKNFLQQVKHILHFTRSTMK